MLGKFITSITSVMAAMRSHTLPPAAVDSLIGFDGWAADIKFNAGSRKISLKKEVEIPEILHDEYSSLDTDTEKTSTSGNRSKGIKLSAFCEYLTHLSQNFVLNPDDRTIDKFESVMRIGISIVGTNKVSRQDMLKGKQGKYILSAGQLDTLEQNRDVFPAMIALLGKIRKEADERSKFLGGLEHRGSEQKIADEEMTRCREYITDMERFLADLSRRGPSFNAFLDEMKKVTSRSAAAPPQI